MKRHHIIQWIGLPILLIGSDLFIGFFGHYSGSVDNILDINNFISYITSGATIVELGIITVIAIVVLGVTEWIVRERLNDKKTKRR